MHILHLIESLEFGGAEKVVVHLANKLSKHYTISVCITKRRGELEKLLDKNIKVYYLNTGEGNSFELPKKLKSLIIDNNIDIVQCHNWGLYLEATLATKLSGRAKLINTVHGHYTQYPDGLVSSIKIYLRHLLERLASLYTYKIITVSDSIQDYIINDIHISEQKLLTIRNGITALQIDKSIKHDKPDTTKLITVGRLAQIKNHKLLLEALKLSIDHGTSVTLTIIGDGPEMNNLVEQTRLLGIADSVTFLGFRNDISTLLQSHDVFVLSSDYEGVSIAILEAMSISLPVIATNVGGNSEVVVDSSTGLIVDKGNAEMLSSAIDKLSNSSELRETFGKQGKNNFDRYFDEDIVLNQYIDLYTSCQG